MKQKIAVYLPLFCLLSYWYVEFAAVFLAVLLTGNIFKIFLRIQQKTFPIFIIVCGDRDVYYGST